MMRRTGPVSILILFASCLGAPAQDSGLAFLKINGSAASAPLGAAAVAGRFPDAVLSNPAGMVATDATILGSSYGSWLQMVQFGQFYAVFVPRDRHRLGISLYHMRIPGIERRYTAQDRVPVAEFEAANQALGLSYAFLPVPNLGLGFSLHLLRQAIDSYSGSSAGIDMGLQYRLLQSRITFGMAYRNQGRPLPLGSARIPLPKFLDSGLAVRATRLLDFYLGLRQYEEGVRQLHVAGTWSLANSEQNVLLQVRVGYQSGDGRTLQQGMKWGLGLTRDIRSLCYLFDYSYVPFETLGQTHLFSLQVSRVRRAAAVLSADRDRFSPVIGQVNFGLRAERMPSPGSWQFRLSDEKGLLQNEFSGPGMPPETVIWNGRDRDERILPDGYYHGLLTLFSAHGVAAVSNQKRVLLDSRPPDIRLQLTPRFLTSSQNMMTLEPRLVKSVETDFINPVHSWTVKILDHGRRGIKHFQGPGEPPAFFNWDLHTDDQQSLVPGMYMALAEATDIVGNLGRSDTLIFTMGYEMRTEVKNAIKETRTSFIATLGSILFDFDRATLRPAAQDVLRNIAMIMSYYPASTATIGGHTDSKGSEEYNRNLSARRAEEVRRHLTEYFGIATDRLRVQWYGKGTPVASNETDEGRQLNRRVEVTITLDGSQGR
jgi:outer membrane protein OmpA-like peptidoglycan-associated protein